MDGHCIALDVMGGDHAPHATLQGAREALEAWPGLRLLLVGNESVILPELVRHGFTKDLLARAEIVNALQTVVMEDKATCILKEKKNSSIRIAAQLVRDGKAHGVVSMGHTGAAMVASSLVIGKLEGVDRPALASVLPNKKGGPTTWTAAPSTSPSSRSWARSMPSRCWAWNDPGWASSASVKRTARART